jgi:probable rRNA maturation factor
VSRTAIKRTKAKAPQKASLPSINILLHQKRYTVNAENMRDLVRSFFLFHHLPHDEVTIQFVTKARITKLHGDHFDDPTITDCISFPMDAADDPGYKVLGEVFVCPGVAFEYAREHGVDYTEELELYVTHGLLHLIGFDDIKKEDRKIMRQEEQRFLTHFRS